MSDNTNSAASAKPKVKHSLLILGVALMITGITLSFVLPPEPNPEAWLDQTFTVQQGQYESFSQTFSSPDTIIHIKFDVAQGDTIDFWVMNEENFLNFTSSQPFTYYPTPSAARISGKELDWVPFLDSPVHFVWDNPDYTSSKEVQALVEVKSMLTQKTEFPLSTFIWLPLFLIGLALVGLGLRPLTLASSLRKKVWVGYAFVVLGGLLGIILGIYLRSKKNPEANFHGLFILFAGLLGTVLYVISVFY